MKKLLINVLSESAMNELNLMESDNKIMILNEEDVKRMNEERSLIWKEIEEYTYDNIIKKVKENVQ